MTKRTQFLREETLSGRNKAARALMPDMDVSGAEGGIPIRKALAFKAICDRMPLYIGQQELIVGTRTWFAAPDYSCGEINWACPPLLAFPKYVNDEDIRRFGGDYHMYNGQHYTPDFGILLSKGVGGILREAKARKLDTTLRPDQVEFLDSLILSYTGLKNLIVRYSDYAHALSDTAENDSEKQRLLEISRVCAHISEDVPRSFREAVQLLWFGHLGTILESFYFINYGRLDVILTPFLGDTPRDEALELLECLLLKFYDQADVQDQSYFGKHEGQLVMTLGGELPNGESAVSQVTLLFLDAIGFTRLPEPECNLRISSKNPPEYLDKAAALTISGCNFVSYYNDDAIIPALISGGMKPEDARSYAFDLCQDLTIPGKSDLYNIYGYPMANSLMEILLQRDDFVSFEELLNALKEHFVNDLRCSMEMRNREQENFLLYGTGRQEDYLANKDVSPSWDGRHPMCPLPYLSGLFHGCMEQATDMIYEPYPIKHKGAILGMVVEAVNSLAAIKKVVYEDRRYALSEVVAACREDFRGEGQEVMRRILWNAPKWGNDDPYVDSIAKELAEFCLTQMQKYETFTGGRILSGIHQPHPVPSGAGLMATPEGRRSGMPAAVTMTPESGTMKNGATAALKSASVFDPMLLQWNYCFMINYYASVFPENGGREIFKKLLLTYFRRGGVQHQPNVMDAEQLKLAQQEPEKFKDLIVRLWGVSAHFVDLPKELQDEMIARLS